MSLFDKVANYVTGGAAKVTLELPTIGFVSMPIPVKVRITAEADFTCTGTFLDVQGVEHLQFRPREAPQDVTSVETTYRQSLKVNDGFTLKKGESKEVAAVVTLPREAQPSYAGKHGKHTWTVQARLEAKGNDPDSGWQPIRIGAMS